MNIVNVETVNDFCESLAAAYPDADRVLPWLRSNLRKHILRTPEYHAPARTASALGALSARGLLDSIPDWLSAALARNDDIVAFDPELPASHALAETIASVVEWLYGDEEAPAGDRLARMPVEDAAAAAAAWHLAQARRRIAAFAKKNKMTEREATSLLASRDPAVSALWPDDPAGVVLAADFPDDGACVVELVSADSLEREGVLLDHCVATYTSRVLAGSTRIFSVRDRANMPLATLEIAPFFPKRSADAALSAYFPSDAEVVKQAFGRGNAPVPDAIRSAIIGFLIERGVSTTTTSPKWLAGLGLDIANRCDADMLCADFGALAANDPSPPWVKAGPTALNALRMLLARAEPLSDDQASGLLNSFLPHPGAAASVREDRTIAGRTVSGLRTTIPVGVFCGASAFLRDQRGDEIAAAMAKQADAVIDALRREPKAVHAIAFSIPLAFPVPDAFFAYAGRLPEWTEARARANSACRAALTALSAHVKATLGKNPNMPQADRDRLLNALNTTLPAMIAPLQPKPSAPRASPAPTRTPTPSQNRIPERPGKAPGYR